MKITDIAKVIAPQAKHKIIGIRPGEKLHEQMISSEDSVSTYEYSSYYKILPQIFEWEKDNSLINNGKKVPADFIYSSNNNTEWMTESDLQKWINTNQDFMGKI